MKKIILMVAFVLAFTCFGAHYTQEQVAEFRQSLANLPASASEYQKATLTLKIAIGETPDENITSFEDLANICKQDLAKYETIDDKDFIANRWACLEVVNYFNQFFRDAYNMAKIDNNLAYYRIANKFRVQLGLSNEEVAIILGNHLIEKKEGENEKQVFLFTKIFVERAVYLKEEDAKSYLKQLNRVYTPLLLKNKAKWEPTIALIRTALETY